MSSIISANKLMRLAKKYEKPFSMNSYNGDMASKESLVYEKGNIPILISAPHGVNHIRAGKVKYADMYTGSLVKVMHKLTECHLIYKTNKDGADPNYDSYEMDNDYKKTIENLIIDNNIKLFIDLHGCAKNRDLDMDIGTNFERSLNGFDDLPEIIKTIFANKGILKVTHNKIFFAHSSNNITRNIGERTGIPSLQLEVNREYRDFNMHFDKYQKLVNALYETICFFKCFYNSPNSYVFKAERSKRVFPWDKIEFAKEDAEKYGFKENDTFQIRQFEYPNDLYQALTRYKIQKDKGELKEGSVYLTPRVYDQIFPKNDRKGEEPTYKTENPSYVIVHKNKAMSLEIGVPKVGIEKVFFGSEVCKNININNSFQLYNRMENIEYSLDCIEESEQSKNSGKLFLNYYQRLLMDMNIPMKVISAEDFDYIQKRIQEEKDKSNLSACHQEIFKAAYERDREYFKIKSSYIGDFKLKEIFKVLELNRIELIESNACEEEKIKFSLKNYIDNISNIVLRKIINTKKISLRIARPYPTDENSDIVRLMPNTMKVLGISELDKVVISHKDKSIILRVLEFDSLEILQQSNEIVYDMIEASVVIGIPAKYRNELGILNINSIVNVSRDMRYLFVKNSDNQVLPIIAVIFTIIQTFTQTSYRIVLSLIFIPLAIYFSLSQERSKIDKKNI